MRFARRLGSRLGCSTLLMAVAMVACGSTDGESAGDGGGDGGAAGDALSGSDGRQALPDGSDTEGGSGVDGYPRRYVIESVPDHSSALALARSGSGVALAYAVAGGALTVATPSAGEAGAWSIDTSGTSLGANVSFALAPDGTPWIAFPSGGAGLVIAHKDPGGWVTDTVAGTYYKCALAVAADGTPWVVAVGSPPATATAVVLIKRVGMTWSAELAATPPVNKSVLAVAIGLVAGVPQLAWLAQDGSLHLTLPSGATYADAVLGSAQYDGGLALAVDGGGLVHLAYQSGVRSAVHATLVGGVLQTETVATNFDSKFTMRLASAPDGSLAMAWYSSGYGVRVATRAPSGGWFTQAVVGYCQDESRIDLIYDASSTLHVAPNCDTPGVLLQRSVPYPAGYVATCQSVATALCQKASSCCGAPTGQKCCVSSPQKPGSQGDCSKPEWYCEVAVVRDVCADATQDPALASACAAVAGQATCTTSPNPGAAVPDPCSSYF